MPQGRADTIVITGSLLAWAAIFAGSANGMLHVSGKISDGVLALLAVFIAYRLWRVIRRRSRNDA